jgi:two-component system sensor histidine kinase HydH
LIFLCQPNDHTNFSQFLERLDLSLEFESYSLRVFSMKNLHSQIVENIDDKFLNRRQKLFIVFVLVFFITVLHYLTAIDYGSRHVFLRELYFLPIILAAFWFGLRGGLTTSLLVTFVYGPYVLFYAPGPAAHNLGNILELILFNVVGLFLGWMKDREAAQQHKLREAESLAAIGKAVSMVAHDLKTPLIAIGGLSRQLSKKFAVDSPQGEKIQIIRQQSDRLEYMILNMLDFAKPLNISRKPCDMSQILKQAHDVVHETALRQNIKVDIQKNELADCILDEEKMLQVLINLISNAIEASPNGETVKVSLQTHMRELLIEVSDRGVGVDKSISKKIFEPFISTKNKGTGLGLPICKKIIEAHAGKLEYRNNIDCGVTFRISIPTEH